MSEEANTEKGEAPKEVRLFGPLLRKSVTIW